MTDGSKVIILDTDHLQNNGNALPWADRRWVWKCFTRGYNPIYMDQLDQDPANFGGAHSGNISPNAEDVRKAMGYARGYADRMDLIDTTPEPALSQTGYVLANVGSEYLVYQWDQSHQAFSTFGSISLPAAIRANGLIQHQTQLTVQSLQLEGEYISRSLLPETRFYI